jgi:hypothetical protein
MQPPGKKRVKSPVKGPQSDLPTRTLATIQAPGALGLTVKVRVGPHTLKANIDSGAEINCISPRTVNKYGLPWVWKEEPLPVTNAEGSYFEYGGGLIDRELDHFPVTISGRTTFARYDVLQLTDHDLILGYPWLRENNPIIDWETGRLQWRDTASHPDMEEGKRIERKIQDTLAEHDDSQDVKTDSREKSHDVLTQTAVPPKLRSKQQQGHTKRRHRIVARIRRELHEINEHLEEQKEKHKTLDELMEAIPTEYHQYRKLFEEELDTGLPEHSQWDHEICLKDGENPKFYPIYNLNETQLTTLREYLENNLRKGYIRTSTSSAGYPVMFVPKKNGKLRLVVDYRQLNGITHKDRTPLPLMTELRDRLHGKSWFTALDLRSAYNLIRVKEGEEWKTAFRTKFGLYEYLVMPFGLTNAPATFQRMINNVLREYLDIFVVVYLDDILIFSENLEEHKEHVHKILQTLLAAKLLVDPEKSHFHVQEVTFLGHIIRPNQISMDPEKVKAVRDWEAPGNVKDVQSFLGFANYYRRFIKDFSKIAKPLTELTKKEEKFEWTEERETAFQNVKKQITAEPVLATFDPDKEIELETDASDYALGSQLGQRDDQGRLHPVAFWSKKLNGAELNYPIYDKEFLAIVESFKEFRHYLLGSKHKVKVFTDHKNIAYFATTQQLSGRQLRYAEYLQEFDYEIKHVQGKENGRADAISRRPDYDTGKEKTTGQLLEKRENGSYTQRSVGRIVRKIEPNVEWITKIQTITSKLPQAPKGCTDTSPMLYNNRIWIPEELRTVILKEIHAHPTSGHQGIRKTLERVRRTYDYHGIKNDIAKIIASCECARNKTERHKPYGLLQPLPVPEKPWDTITMDFIVKLPLSKDPSTGIKYDSIFVVVDKLTKYAHFIPYKESTDAETMAHIFFQNIVTSHGLPDKIISDRGSTFNSKFWKTLTARMGIKPKLSTAYHPETDGQTEIINQILEQYLRNYVNYEQNDWVSHLPTAQIAYNSAATETTKVTPFYANYGYEPDFHKQTLPDAIMAEKAIITAERLRSLHAYMKKELEFVAERMTKYANSKRSRGPILERGDMVYLLRRNILTKRPNEKLDHKKLGPFPVLRNIKDTSYELKLPESMKIHPVFHVSLLEPADKDTIVITPEIEINEPEYTAEAILDKSIINGETKYLVKWKNYPDSENTWEPIKHLENCQPLVRRYHQTRDHQERNSSPPLPQRQGIAPHQQPAAQQERPPRGNEPRPLHGPRPSHARKARRPSS